MNFKQLFADDRGVSPVIGVILMVAITVILAAVIGTFVLGLSDQIQDTSPRATIGADDASNDWQVDDGSLQNGMILTHNGGDGIELGDVKIVVRQQDGATDATFESGGWEATGNGNTLEVKLNGASIADGDQFSTGDTLTIVETSDNGTTAGGVLSDDTKYTVQIIHSPSGSVIGSQTVTLR